MPKYTFLISFGDTEIYDGEIEAKNLNDADQKIRDQINLDIHEQKENI